MNDTSNLKTFRKRVAYTMLIVFVLHAGAALFFVFARDKADNYPRWLKLYRNISHIGPFFRVESLKGTYQAVVHIQNPHNGSRIAQPLKDYVEGYHDQPWRFDRLLLRDYLRAISREITKEQEKGREHLVARYSNQLNDLVNHEVRFETGDSVTYFFIWKSIRPQSGFDSDTLLTLPIKTDNAQ